MGEIILPNCCKCLQINRTFFRLLLISNKSSSSRQSKLLASSGHTSIEVWKNPHTSAIFQCLDQPAPTPIARSICFRPGARKPCSLNGNDAVTVETKQTNSPMKKYRYLIGTGVLLAALAPLQTHAAANTWNNAQANFQWDFASTNWTSPTIWADGDDAIFGATE